MGNIANLTILDYALLPFYLAFVYAIAYRFRDKHYKKNHPWRKYFIPALSIKIFGAIFIGLIYGYYYKGGDTYYYFYHGQVINESFNESAWKWVNLLLRIPEATDGAYYEYISRLEWYPSDPASYYVSSITALFSAATFNTYLPASVLFAFVSFSGIWALFRTFASVYPHLIRPIAVAILFIPSVYVWGSGIFKDTICMFGLGWLTYGTFRFMMQKDFSGKNIALVVMSFILIANIKPYILIAYVPALLMWAFFNYTKNITNRSLKSLVKFIFITAIIAGFLFVMQRFSDELGKYSLDEVAKTSAQTSGYINYVSGDEGSGYSLGEYDANILGMMTKFPLAVNVTLFRPYIWEAKKIIVALSALEALIFLLLTLKILFVVGVRNTWKTISAEPTVQFCLIFAIIFAFAVGLSSGNFGTLSRYKIPCLPFYALAMILIYYKNMPLKKKLFRPFNI